MKKQTVKLFRLTKEINKDLEIEVGKIMDELNDFFGLDWVENVPKIYFLDSRKLINEVRNHKTEDWLVGWSDNKTVYLLDQDKFETESDHGKIEDKKYSALIKHELCHAFQTASGYFWKPNWLREGLCHYVSGQIEFEKNPKLFKYFLDFYEKTGAEVHWESGWVVKLLVDKFGKEKLMELFKEAKNKKPDEEGFKKIFATVYGIDLSYESLNKLLG
jgi:hypothetical protein